MAKIKHSSNDFPQAEKLPRVYEKPFFKEEERMTFPVDIINSLGHSIRCNQCSACHGCA